MSQAEVRLDFQEAPLLEGRNEAEAQKIDQFRARWRGGLQGISFEAPSLHERSERYWQIIQTTPNNLRLGLVALITEGVNSVDANAATLFQDYLVARTPELVRRTLNREDRFLYAYEASLAAMSASESTNVRLAFPTLKPGQALKGILRCLKEEERLITLNSIYRMSVASNATGFISDLRTTHRALIERLRRQNKEHIFDDENLRLATAAHQTNLIFSGSMGIAFMQELGNSYLDKFLTHFADKPAEGVAVVAQAMSNSFSLVTDRLAGFITGKGGWFDLTKHPAGSDKQTLVNLLPLLTGTAALAKAEMREDRVGKAVRALRTLIEASVRPIEDRSDGAKKVPILTQIGQSSDISIDEKITIGRVFLKFMESTGYRFDELSDEEVLLLGYGSLEFCIAEEAEGNPVFVKGEDGETLIRVGYYEKPKPPAPPATNSHVKATVAEPVSDMVEEIQVEEVLSDEEKALIILRGIFPQDAKHPSLEDLDRQIARFWADLDPRSPELKRTSSIGPLGFRFKFIPGRAIRAPEDFLPQVEFRRIPESETVSDIGGTVRLSQELAFPFLIDVSGGIGGAIANLVDMDPDPYDLYYQINHEIVHLAHTRLVKGEEELQARIKAAIDHATAEIMSPDSKRGGSQARKVAEQLEKSKSYLIEVVSEGGKGLVRRIDRDKVTAELKPGESKRIYQTLTSEDIVEGSRRKGSAKPHAVTGGAVWMPWGYNPRRTAIDNALANHVVLVKATEYYLDQDGETITDVVIKQTFRGNSYNL